jgi:hypothetical protein
MKLNAKAFAITAALAWGGSIFVVALLNRFWGNYGVAYLNLAASLYPGFHPGGMKAGIVGTLYGMLDGAVGGFVVAWLYNKLSDYFAAA